MGSFVIDKFLAYSHASFRAHKETMCYLLSPSTTKKPKQVVVQAIFIPCQKGTDETVTLAEELTQHFAGLRHQCVACCSALALRSTVASRLMP